MGIAVVITLSVVLQSNTVDKNNLSDLEARPHVRLKNQSLIQL